jgi:hypothetical protein
MHMDMDSNMDTNKNMDTDEWKRIFWSESIWNGANI